MQKKLPKMKQKYLRITMPDGSRWDVPAVFIAKSRATYYAAHDTNTTNGPKFDKVYKEEFQNTMSDDSELSDWAANNMNWVDVSSVACKVQIEEEEIDYQEGWLNGEKEIVQY